MDPILLSTHEIGSGLPILIIHGWQMSSQVEAYDFEPVFTQIPNLHRIYVDLPGTGSSPSHNIKTQDDIYHHLTQFIDARLKHPTRFLLVGSSCGAYLARALAQKYIDRVDGLLLRVPLIEPDDEKRDLEPFVKPLVTDEEFMSRMPIEDKTLLGENLLIQTSTYVKPLQRKYKEVYQIAEQASDSAVLDPIRADPQRYRLSIPLDEAKFFAPTLVVSGRQDDVVGYRDGLRLLELYPRSTHVVLDRGTHALPVGKDVVFDALVRDWIVRVEEWRAHGIGEEK